MKQISLTAQRKNEAGFTLVELAVVLIIIGLLVGGVLKGQELIENSRIKSTITQIEGVRTAVQAFRDRYGAYPGDINNPTDRLPNCATGTPCAEAGDGNGRFENAVKDAPTAAQEGAVAFVHLAAAGFVTGIEPGGMVFGENLLAAKVGGGFWMASIAATGDNPNGVSLRSGPYIVLNGETSGVGAATGILSASQAAQIDRALDDGTPDTGSVQASGTTCVNSGAYAEGTAGTACTLYISL